MQAIADWLEKLGMSEYAQRFAVNCIDFSILRHLTDQDLKDCSNIFTTDGEASMRFLGQAERALLRVTRSLPRVRDPGRQ